MRESERTPVFVCVELCSSPNSSAHCGACANVCVLVMSHSMQYTHRTHSVANWRTCVLV